MSTAYNMIIVGGLCDNTIKVHVRYPRCFVTEYCMSCVYMVMLNTCLPTNLLLLNIYAICSTTDTTILLQVAYLRQTNPSTSNLLENS